MRKKKKKKKKRLSALYLTFCPRATARLDVVGEVAIFVFKVYTQTHTDTHTHTHTHTRSYILCLLEPEENAAAVASR